MIKQFFTLCFLPGNLCMVTGGANLGRIGVITNRERHPGSFDVVHVKDSTGNSFATRLSNIFVIGKVRAGPARRRCRDYPLSSIIPTRDDWPLAECFIILCETLLEQWWHFLVLICNENTQPIPLRSSELLHKKVLWSFHIVRKTTLFEV